MSNAKKTPAAPAPVEPTPPETALVTLEHEFEVMTGPDMTVFADRVREVQQTIQTKRVQVAEFMLRRQVDIAYDLVEIGWILLQGKAAIEHGSTGNNNATKNGTETVSDPFSGFGNWLAATFADINERSARNYMNAARNLKLTDKSTREDVRALRDNKVLEDKRLKDLYLPPKGEEESVDPEADAEHARAQAETKRFEESLFDLTQLGVEKRVFIALPKPRLQIIKGQLHDLQKAVSDALKA